MFRPLFAAAALLAWSAPALAAPLTPWGVHVGKGVVALTPYVFFDQTPGVYPYVYGQYGLTDNLELFGGVGATVLPFGSVDEIELAPRYFFHETTAAVLHLTYAPGDTGLTVAPEVHGVYPLGPIELTVNAGWSPFVGSAGFSAGTVDAIVAPEWYFTDASSLFVEINPTVDLTAFGTAGASPLYMEVIPGVSTSIAETHYFAFGVAIPVTGFDPTAIYGGLYYSIAFGGAEE